MKIKYNSTNASTAAASSAPSALTTISSPWPKPKLIIPMIDLAFTVFEKEKYYENGEHF